jgi:hypothetical protein
MPATPAKRRLQGAIADGWRESRSSSPPIKKTSLVLGETRQQVTDKGRREIEDTR